MKKKILLALVVIVVVMVTLTACNLVPQDKDDVYTTLNKLALADYSNITLNIQTTYRGYTLNSKYVALQATNGTMVSYSVESLATIDADEEGNYQMPQDMIVKKEGSATIKDGKIVTQTGDTIDVPANNLQSVYLDFNANYFSAAQNYNEADVVVFKATVTNPKAFTFNQNFDGNNMTVEARYKEKLNSVLINYTSLNGAQVKVSYSFQ